MGGSRKLPIRWPASPVLWLSSWLSSPAWSSSSSVAGGDAVRPPLLRKPAAVIHQPPQSSSSLLWLQNEGKWLVGWPGFWWHPPIKGIERYTNSSVQPNKQWVSVRILTREMSRNRAAVLVPLLSIRSCSLVRRRRRRLCCSHDVEHDRRAVWWEPIDHVERSHTAFVQIYLCFLYYNDTTTRLL